MPYPSLQRPGIALILSLILISCAEKDPKSPKFVVAEGKGVTVTRGELDQEEALFLKQRGSSRDQVPPDQLGKLEESLLDRIVTSQLLEQEAKGLKIPDLESKINDELARIKKMFPDEATFQKEIVKTGLTMEQVKENIRHQVLFREVINQKVPETGDLKPEAIQTYYKENPKNFEQPEMVKASHILIKVPPNASPADKTQRKKMAESAKARVAKGEPFSKVAREVSEDPGSAQQGGDLGDFRRGEMVPEFDKVAFSTKVGAVSDVFETPFGFHFLTVTGHKEAKTIPLDEARPQIEHYLRDRDRSRRLEEYLKKLKEDAKITTKLPPAPAASQAPMTPAQPPAPAGQ